MDRWKQIATIIANSLDVARPFYQSAHWEKSGNKHVSLALSTKTGDRVCLLLSLAKRSA